VDIDTNPATGEKDHLCIFERLELWCVADELGEVWGMKYELVEEVYLQAVK
jgi:hypothetical protein